MNWTTKEREKCRQRERAEVAIDETKKEVGSTADRLKGFKRKVLHDSKDLTMTPGFLLQL